MPLAEENFSCTLPCYGRRASAISSAKGCVVLCQACNVKDRMLLSDDGKTLCTQSLDSMLRVVEDADRCRVCTAAQEGTRADAGRVGVMKEVSWQA
jgi:hypothetical protein